MKSDLDARLARVARVLLQLRRVRRAARRVSKHEDQVINGILHLFMPVESLLDKPETENDPVIQEINSAGGIRPWAKQMAQRMKKLGRPRYQSLVFIYSRLKDLVDKYEVRTAAGQKKPLLWRFTQSERSGRFYVRVWDNKGAEKDFLIKADDGSPLGGSADEAKKAGHHLVQRLEKAFATNGYELKYHKQRKFPWGATRRL